MPDNQIALSRRVLLQSITVLGAGVVVGAVAGRRVDVSLVGAASPQAADPTATRQAELQELNDLRTQVANPPVCTPAPTETAIPATATATQAPLAEMGQPLPYLDIWTISVLGIAPTPGSDEFQPAGQFMQVNMNVAHSSSKGEFLLFNEFLLIDSNGRFSVFDTAINQQLLGIESAFDIKPGVTEPRAMIFDVAADAGDSFVLESSADPSFRVALTIEQRG